MTSITQFSYGSAPTRRLDVLDYALFLPCVWIACSLGFSLRLIGSFFIAVPLLCLLYSVLRSTVPPRMLAAYVALCALAGVLSHYRVFPASWQVVFLDEAIARQLIPVIAFFAVAWASKAYFRRRLFEKDVFAGELVIMFLSFVVAPLVMLQQGVKYQEDDTTSSVLAAYGAFINNIVIGLFFITGRLFGICTRRGSHASWGFALPLSRTPRSGSAPGWSRFAAGASILLVAATTHFAQFRLMTVAAVATLLGSARLVALGVAVGLVISYALQMNHIAEVMASYPNEGIRLAFVADAFSSLVDTYGLGVGYGTEAVKWTYQFPGLPKITFMRDPTTITTDRLLELLSRGLHNSFAQAMLRTGAIGALLLSCAVFAAFPPRNLASSVRAHASVLFVIIFTACFVNPALESPVQVVGIGFVYGYLLALRGFATASRRLIDGAQRTRS